jgi:SHS2 domain-containing protein
MNGFKILPHTADIRFELRADSLEELFRQGMSACSYIAGGERIEIASPEMTSKIEIESPDLTALLIDFLSEAVSVMDSQKMIINSVDFVELTKTKLIAYIKGNKAQLFDKSIKAVTYHEANVIFDESGEYSTMVVIDI